MVSVPDVVKKVPVGFNPLTLTALPGTQNFSIALDTAVTPILTVSPG